MAQLKKNTGEGGARMDGFSSDNIYDLLASIINDITALKQEVTDLDTAGSHGITIATLETTIES